MIINFVTPRIDKITFSGGIYCILKYAQGLLDKGHEVNIITPAGSHNPEWIKCEAKIISANKAPLVKSRFSKLLSSLAKNTLLKHYKLQTTYLQNALFEECLPHIMPNADVTIATAWDTAFLVKKYGSGECCYFMQHFEAYFCNNIKDIALAEASYKIGLNMIANSLWLKKFVSSHINNNAEILQCTNAVDLDKFYIENKRSSVGKTVNIISYGGRDVKWKGFDEMAKAISKARNHLPEWTINWNVYGSASLEPNNDIAPYNHLGFLQPDKLRAAYNQNDILLSASWYESFPLFPIEAMACGLAVITTEKGTEDYAKHNDNAFIVEAQDIESIANGIIELVKNTELRQSISSQAVLQAQKFNWDKSISNMEECLKKITHR